MCTIQNLSNTIHTIRVENNNASCINISRFQIKKQITNSLFVNSSARILGFDKETNGNWIVVYGIDGYLIHGCDIEYPICGDISVQTEKIYHNNDIMSSLCLMQSPYDSNSRIAKCYYDEDRYELDIILCGYKSKKLLFTASTGRIKMKSRVQFLYVV